MSEGLAFGGIAVTFYCGDPADEYEIEPGVFERIDPRAFDRSLSGRRDVVAVAGHKKNRELGRVGDGSLKLRCSGGALVYQSIAPATDVNHGVATWIATGNARGSSIRFRANRERRYREWRRGGGVEVRVIVEADLFTVGPVERPAYQRTTCYATSLEDIEAAERLWRESRLRAIEATL